MKKILLFLFISAVAVVAAIRPLTVLETSADLTARLPGTKDTVYLLGVSSINDGNGGIFYWDPASTTTPDGVDVFQLDAGGTGRYIRVVTPGGTGGGSATSSALTLTDLYLLNPSTGNYIHVYINGIDGNPTINATAGSTGGTTNNYSAIWLTNSASGGWTKLYVNGGADNNPQIQLSNGGSLGGTNNFYPFKLVNQSTTTQLTLGAIGSAATPTIQIQ